MAVPDKEVGWAVGGGGLAIGLTGRRGEVWGREGDLFLSGGL